MRIPLLWGPVLPCPPLVVCSVCLGVVRSEWIVVASPGTTCSFSRLAGVFASEKWNIHVIAYLLIEHVLKMVKVTSVLMPVRNINSFSKCYWNVKLKPITTAKWTTIIIHMAPFACCQETVLQKRIVPLEDSNCFLACVDIPIHNPW